MMSELTCGEWEIYFHPQLFGRQYRELLERVEIKASLSPDEFKTHATVKLFAAINIGIESKIPDDPFAAHFALTGVIKNIAE